ncbi:MAG: ABC transporter permease [Planctomycetes bacterium]|nr:ABC transporter permease [Planctomycetota bacterium]
MTDTAISQSQPIGVATDFDVKESSIYTSFVLPSLTLGLREGVRFFRQRSRLIGALATPVIFWAMLGFGMQKSFAEQTPGETYAIYFYPGIILMMVLFSSIFSTISVIEDRNEGFLQAVLVAPVSRFSIVVGKVIGTCIVVFIQSCLLLAFAPLAGLSFSFLGALAAIGVLLIVSAGLTGMGFFFAWKINSVGGFHGVMNLVLLPMWMLSGAMFPYSGAHEHVQWTMLVNPMTYGCYALRGALSNLAPSDVDAPTMTTCLAVCAGFSLLMIFFAARALSGRKN